MPLLHMDVDACRGAAANLQTTGGQMDASASALLNAVNGLVGAGWISPGAVQYQASFQQWQAGMGHLLDLLKQMSLDLESEVQEWEQVSGSF